MITLEVNRQEFKYRYLPEVGADESAQDTCRYIFDKYSEEFLERLYRLQGSLSACHALVLFEPSQADVVLRHINIIDGFTFTLVPTEVNKDVYEQIYTFFMTSPLSVAYITWIAKLILSPYKEVDSLSFNRTPMRYSPCWLGCQLKAKACSKPLLFTELFHPMKHLPTDEDFTAFCDIHREFSFRIVRDYLESTCDVRQFDTMRKSVGVNHQYWIDPQRIFAPGSQDTAAQRRAISSWLACVGGELSCQEPAGLAAQLLDSAYDKTLPTAEIGYTAFNSEDVAIALERDDEAEGGSLALHVDKLSSSAEGCSLAALCSPIVASGTVENYPMVKMDYNRKAEQITRYSFYYRLVAHIKDVTTIRPLFEESPFDMTFDDKRFEAFAVLIGEDVEAAGFTLKVRPDTGERILRLWVNTSFQQACSFARSHLSVIESANIDRIATFVTTAFADRTSSVFMGMDAASNRPASPLVFSIDLHDITPRKLISLLGQLGDPAADMNRIRTLAPNDAVFDFVKFRPTSLPGGITVKYSISHANATKRGAIK